MRSQRAVVLPHRKYLTQHKGVAETILGKVDAKRELLSDQCHHRAKITYRAHEVIQIHLASTVLQTES